MARLFVVLLFLPLAGCLGPGTTTCDVIQGADRSTRPYDFGVALYTKRDGTTVDAWACNESSGDRYLLAREGGCPGSWSWTYQADASTGTAQWPPETNYGACESWIILPAGRGVHERLELSTRPSPGGEWIIRLQVYTQDEMIEDAGGGPVHAVYRF